MTYLSDVAALTRKDLLLELRAKETLPAMLLFVLSALAILHFAVPDASGLAEKLLESMGGLTGVSTEEATRLLAEYEELASFGLLWTALIFTALLGLTRAFVPEREQHTMDVLVLAPADRSAIWLAKSIAVFVFLAVAELVALPAFSLFFQPVDGNTIAAVALANVGICAVGTLTGAMAVAGRARELILPLLFLPMAIPIVVGGVGASTGAGGKYLAFLALYDAVFVLLSWASFDYVVAEA
jgi:heme exporter protein B